jgi:zinc finger BED domain-containing protein 1 (E3 SUMO-protein ligase ZBED1)
LGYNLSEPLAGGREDTRRPVGIHPHALLASALDPRFKNLPGISAGATGGHHHDLWKRLIEAAADQMQRNEEGSGNGGGGRGVDVLVIEDVADADASPFGSLAASGPQRAQLAVRAETVEQRKIRCHAAAVREVTGYKREPLLPFYVKKQQAAPQAQGEEEEEEEGEEVEEKRECSDPLLWWKEHAARFPLLAQLARRLLAIPATSAPSERLFSASGQLVSLKRASLSPETVEDIMLLRGSWDATEKHVQKVRQI